VFARESAVCWHLIKIWKSWEKHGMTAKFVEMARALHPGVVLLDIAMPLLDGLKATRRISKLRPNVKVIILSAHNDDAYVNEALLSGASGFSS
jgi:DNA-binding NarL/FixJ family response regulator